jgi:hypothetical protein
MATVNTHGLAEENVADDENEVVSHFITFLENASVERNPKGPILRFNQTRTTGCVEAEFTVRDDIPPEDRVGLFAAPRTFRAFIRFASTSHDKTDKDKDVHGMSISLADVPGENLTPGSTKQDFVLNSHPVMVAPNTKEFLEFLEAFEAGGVRKIAYLATHPHVARIGLAAQQHPTCHLDIPYWSTTPYLFGPGRAVKYYTRPCSTRRSTLPADLTDHYLRDALRAHLAEDDACFDFMIQFQVDTERTPIEDASVEWKEEVSPYRPVARIRIPHQRIDDSDRVSACEHAAFNPWNSLVNHRPLGNMNRARKLIYQTLGQFRQEFSKRR